MSLPVSQQRALDAIDHELGGADTRLAGMFGVFTELTRLEKMPPAETLRPGRWWARAGRGAAAPAPAAAVLATGRWARSCWFRCCSRPR